MSMYKQTTVEMARQAALAINEFMAHWNDRLDEHYHSSTFHGAKVRRLSRILATPEHQSSATIWEASFDRDCTNLCFQICDGLVHFPPTRTFFEEIFEISSPSNQRPSEHLNPDQSNRC